MSSIVKDYFRSAHPHPNQVYSCVPCQKTFKEWKNFKRHEMEKHGPAGRFKCSKCPYSTNRNETLQIHFTRKHSGLAVVSLLLDDIIDGVGKRKDVVARVEDQLPSNRIVSSVLQDMICEVVEDRASDDGNDKEMSADEEEISEFEKLRNINIAQIKAQFELLFPEKKALQVVRPKKKRQTKIWQVPTRRSSRIQLLAESVEESNTTAEENFEDREREDTSELERTETDSAATATEAGDDCVVDGIVGDVPVVAGNGDMECDERDDNMEVTEPVGSDLGRFACIPCKMPFRYCTLFFISYIFINTFFLSLIEILQTSKDMFSFYILSDLIPFSALAPGVTRSLPSLWT